MTVQLPLPGHWPRNMSRRDPVAALEHIERDKVEAKHEIRLVGRFIQIAGYRCLSLMRALGVVKCQFAVA